MSFLIKGVFGKIAQLGSYVASKVKSRPQEVAERVLSTPSPQPLPDTTLHEACITKNFFTISQLLAAFPTHVNVPDAMGYTPLMYVIEDEALVVLLLKKGANPNVTGIDGSTPLSIACQQNKAAVVKILLEHGALPDKGISLQNCAERPPLHLACGNNNLELVKMLLRAGADLNLSHDGATAFQACSLVENNDAIIEFLLAQGAKPTIDEKLNIIGAHPKYADHFVAREERELLCAKKLAHANHIENQTHAAINYEGWHPSIFYADFAKLLEESTLYSPEEKEQLVAAFHAAAEVPFNAKRAVKKIQAGKLVIVPTGWSRHVFPLVFYGGYMAIPNRGEGMRESSVEVYQIDTSQVNEGLIQEVLNTKKLASAKGQDFIYKTLLQKLHTSKNPDTAKLEKMTDSSEQTVGNCPYANAAGALHVAHGLLQQDESTAVREKTHAVLLKQRLSYLERYLEVCPEDAPLVQQTWAKMKKRVKKHPEALREFPLVKKQLFDRENQSFAARAVTNVKKRASRLKERVLDAAVSVLVPSYVV